MESIWLALPSSIFNKNLYPSSYISNNLIGLLQDYLTSSQNFYISQHSGHLQLFIRKSYCYIFLLFILASAPQSFFKSLWSSIWFPALNIGFLKLRNIHLIRFAFLFFLSKQETHLYYIFKNVQTYKLHRIILDY